MDQDREVFAVTGPVDRMASRGQSFIQPMQLVKTRVKTACYA